MYSDDDDDSEEEKEQFAPAELDADSRWTVLKGNIDFLVARGFNKDAICQCIFVLTRSKSDLEVLCDSHANVTPNEIGEMTIYDQKALLNLIAYYAEKS